jgi:hypothetical protein
VNRSDDVLYGHGNTGWSEVVSGWMQYVNWQLWEFNFMDSYFQSVLINSLPSLDQNVQLDIRNTSWMMLLHTDQLHILDR